MIGVAWAASAFWKGFDISAAMSTNIMRRPIDQINGVERLPIAMKGVKIDS